MIVRDRRARPPRICHYREYPTGGFSKPSRFSSINDIQLLKMYRVSSKSLEEQTFQTGGVRILLFFIKQKGNMGSWFSTLRMTVDSTKADFCYFLTLIVKNTVHLDDGDIWLQLVETFSNLGLHLSEQLLTVDPARGTGYQTILMSSHPGGWKNPNCLLTDEHGKWKFVWLRSRRQKGLRIGRGRGEEGWGIWYQVISRRLKQTASMSCNAEIIIHW